MRGLDPKATQVYSFKTPSPEELKHDFMWRCLKNLPERGRIGIFNRSYYEEVLVSRVHPKLLEQRQLPACCVTPHIWKDRFEDIRHIEQYLARNGTVIRKIFLNVSKAEQRRRFLMRLHNPDKRWKFSLNDINERLRWKEYMAAYEEAMRATSTAESPWYVVPADNKWFTRLAVAAIAIDTLESLNLKVPTLSHHDTRALNHARRRLRFKSKSGVARVTPARASQSKPMATSVRSSSGSWPPAKRSRSATISSTIAEGARPADADRTLCNRGNSYMCPRASMRSVTPSV